MADAEMTLDPIKKAYDEGYAAGWAAFGALMLEQMPEPERVLAREIMEKEAGRRRQSGR